MELKRILVVEDDPRDLELTQEALSQTNLLNEVVSVRDGQEALDYLECVGPYRSRPPGNPAMVLLDLKLPKVDGLQVLQRMRTTETLRLVPVVMLTSSREESDLVAGYRLGVHAYVVKPVDYRKFIDAVRQIGVFWAVLNEPPPGSIRKY